MWIENNTPWNTSELLEFLTPLIHASFTRVTIENHKPRPGQKREEQKLVTVDAHYDERNHERNHLRLHLLTPKRAKARTDTLDRLSLAGSLAAHEAAIPATVLASLYHMLRSITKGRQNSNLYECPDSCKYDSCKCEKSTDGLPIIRGDTKQRTQPPIPLKRLEQQLRWAETGVKSAEFALEKAVKHHARLKIRVERARGKQKAPA
jgi:hypothetical protein